MADTKRDLASLQALFPDSGRGTPQSLRDALVSVAIEGVNATQCKRTAIYVASMTLGSAQTLLTITVPANVNGSFAARIRGHVQVSSGNERSVMRFDLTCIGSRNYVTPAQGASVTGTISQSVDTAPATVQIGSIVPTVVSTPASRTYVVQLNISMNVAGGATTAKVISDVHLNWIDLGADPTVA